MASRFTTTRWYAPRDGEQDPRIAQQARIANARRDQAGQRPPRRTPSTASASTVQVPHPFDLPRPATSHAPGRNAFEQNVNETTETEEEETTDEARHTEDIVVAAGPSTTLAAYGVNSGGQALGALDEVLEIMRAQESAQQGAGYEGDPAGLAATGVGDESARLIELYRSHSRQTVDPNDLRAAIQESLRKKVDSLDDDRWMYEPEVDMELPG